MVSASKLGLYRVVYKQILPSWWNPHNIFNLFYKVRWYENKISQIPTSFLKELSGKKWEFFKKLFLLENVLGTAILIVRY